MMETSIAPTCELFQSDSVPIRYKFGHILVVHETVLDDSPTMLRKGTQVYKPIFIIGVPRSGTTIIFEAFSVHEDLAWFSNMLGRFPDIPEISILNRLSFTNVLRGNKRQNKAHSRLRNIFPYPTECYPAWKSYCGDKFLYDYLIDQAASENEKKRTVRNILKVIRYHGKKRFAAKITGPSRMNYISSIFPDAKFIHIVRDARAVVNSLMNVDFWTESDKLNKPWWENGLTADDMEPLEMFKTDLFSSFSLSENVSVKYSKSIPL